MPKKYNPKLEKAIILLRKGNNCTTVANEIGYTSNYFSKVFKAYFGKNPRKLVGATLTKSLNLVKIDLLIDSHIHHGITEKAIATFFNINLSELKDTFLEQKGLSLSSYIDEKRTDCIITHLKNGYDTSLICKLMNFPSLTAFESFFRRNMGYSISTYCKRVLEELPEGKDSNNIQNEFAKIKYFIKSNLHIDDLPQHLKQTFRLPIWKMEKIFTKFINISLNEFILQEKMQLAKHALQNQTPLENILETIGFDSVDKFAIVYRKTYKEEADLLLNQTAFYFSKKCFEYITKYIKECTSTHMSITLIADFLQLPRSKVTQIIHQNTHLNFLSLVRKVRIEHAQESLRDGVLPEVIPTQVGYANTTNLNIAFKQQNGQSIKQYLASALSNVEFQKRFNFERSTPNFIKAS